MPANLRKRGLYLKAKSKEEDLYKIIVNNSFKLKIDNCLEFVYQQASKLETNNKEKSELIDNVLKRILKNLKDTININQYDIMLSNMGELANQYNYDLTMIVIKNYYENEFIIENQQYSVLDIIFTTIQKYRTNKDKTLFECTSNILDCLFTIHYILYIKKSK